MKKQSVSVALSILACLGSAGAAHTQAAYPVAAPIAEYLMASRADEIALARSAAPASIAAEAEVMTLGRHGYETAAPGKSGFLCMVWRSWTAGFNDAEFWNPKLRAPICLNSAAAHSVLSEYLERTKWVMAGASRTDMLGRTKAAIAANTFTLPAPGAMGFMMSKEGYLSDAVHHWRPHLMFFLPHTDSAAWGADRPGSPISAAQDDIEPTTTFFVPVTNWSDGTSSSLNKP